VSRLKLELTTGWYVLLLTVLAAGREYWQESLSVALVVAGGHCIFLFSHSFETKCVDMAVISVLHAFKLKRWLRSNPVSKFFITQLGHRHCITTIAFILESRM